MSYALPTIAQSADDLKRRLRDERHPRKRQRLHLLFLIASHQVRSRSQLARVLGISRNTVASWLTSYQHGGLMSCLTSMYPKAKLRPCRRHNLSSCVPALPSLTASPPTLKSSSGFTTPSA